MPNLRRTPLRTCRVTIHPKRAIGPDALLGAANSLNNEAAMLQRIGKMNEPSASLLLLLLLSGDFVFTALYIVISVFNPNPSLCNISGICARMNVYHLIKLFWIVLLFAYVLRITRRFGYASWILMFTFFLFDDALLLHQSVGDRIASISDTYLPRDLGLQPRYFELAVLAIAGMLLLAIVTWVYLHNAHEFRKISNDLLLLIAALVFFGLIGDLATALRIGPAVIFGLGIVGDSGEMVVDSLILWSVFRLAICKGKPHSFLLDFLCNPKQGATDLQTTILHSEMRG